MRFSFDHYSVAAILTIVTTAFLSGFALIRGWRQPISRLFGVYTFLICAWAFGWYRMISIEDYNRSIYWARFLLIPAAFIPPIFLQFTQYLLGISRESLQIRIQKWSYIFALLFAALSFHPKFVLRVNPIYDFVNYSEAGPIYTTYLIFFLVILSIIFIQLLTKYKECKGPEKTQIAYVLIAYFVGYAGGTMVFFPGYNIPLPKFAMYMIPIAHVILFYAIVKHQLMDIRIFIRRITAILLIYVILAIVAFAIIFPLVNKIIHNGSLNPLSMILFTGLIVGFILSFGPFLYAYLVRNNYWLRTHVATGITHELKSPLYAIQSALEIISDESPNSSIDKEKNSFYIEMIRKNVTRLDTYVHALLNLAKIQEDDIEIVKNTFNFSATIHDTVAFYKPLIESKKLALLLNIEPDIQINGDAAKLTQVISNLLSNAIKFTSQGNIAIDVNTKNKILTFSVKDNGTGLNKKELSKIFDRFYQAKPNAAGSGIGLTIAKAWVEAHSGKIWAESDGEGKGTTVTFTLPVN